MLTLSFPKLDLCISYFLLEKSTYDIKGCFDNLHVMLLMQNEV
jgi:hypothetical protein